MKDVQKEIDTIKKRNRRVEKDKAWERSWVRRGFISMMTYIIASIVLIFLKTDFPLLNAFIPTIGYILSTLSLPFIKEWWLKSYKK